MSDLDVGSPAEPSEEGAASASDEAPLPATSASPGVATAKASPGVATAKASPGVATASASPGVATAKSGAAAATEQKKAWSPAGALPAKVAYPLAVLCGLLYFLAFPGMDLWPVSMIALVPLIVAMRRQTTRRSTLLGWTAGFTMTMTGFYWLLPMLKVFSGFPTALCIFFMAVLCAYQAGRIALAGFLYGRAETRGWPAPIVFALAFGASELVFPLLFPWYYAATVHNAPVLLQTADLGGPVLVGLVLVAENLAFAEIVMALREKRPLDRRVVGAGLAIPALALAYGVVRMRAVEAKSAAAEKIQIGVVQPNLALFDRKQSIPLHLRMTRELRDEGVGLVVWSEAAISRAFPDEGYEEAVHRGLSRALGVPTILGTTLYRKGQPDATGHRQRGTFFNTALFADEKGVVTGRYDKHYLLAFGEYLPLGETFPILYKWSPNSGHLTPGKTAEPFVWGSHKISALICYEDILPSFVNQVVSAADPDLIVNMTNDAWFGDSTEPWIHLALAKLRSVEHRRYLVRATNSGVSAIVDAVGRVVVHGETFQEETVKGEARFLRAHTVYETLGDIPWWLMTAAIAAMAIWSKPKRAVQPARR
jgi:apolipoprotein N-acyltransferase